MPQVPPGSVVVRDAPSGTCLLVLLASCEVAGMTPAPTGAGSPIPLVPLGTVEVRDAPSGS